MWIHRRIGPNTGVTFGLGGVVLAFLFVGAVGLTVLQTNAFWVALPVVAVIGTYVVVSASRNDTRRVQVHKTEHQAHPAPGCRFCERELAVLRAQANADALRTERDQLRRRYSA